MKACVLYGIDDIRYQEVPTPELKSDEVLVKIKVCGICSSDIERVKKNGAYHYPIILGHEISGEITETGSKEDKHLIGEKVVVFPLLPCKICDNCKNENWTQCSNYNYYGSRCDGGFAQFLAVKKWNIKTFNKSVPFETASLCEPAAVGYHTLSYINKNNRNILIIGTGAIGIITGLWGLYEGYNVNFIARNEKKKQILTEFGFKNIFDNIPENKFDAVIECVGSNESLISAVNAVKSKGQIICTGNPKSDMTLNRNLYWKILRQEINIKGIWNSKYPNDWEYVLNNIDKINAEKIITHKFKLDECNKAFQIMNDNKEFKIKGVFVID